MDLHFVNRKSTKNRLIICKGFFFFLFLAKHFPQLCQSFADFLAAASGAEEKAQLHPRAQTSTQAEPCSEAFSLQIEGRAFLLEDLHGEMPFTFPG